MVILLAVVAVELLQEVLMVLENTVEQEAQIIQVMVIALVVLELLLSGTHRRYKWHILQN
jgi:hypothetical protein